MKQNFKRSAWAGVVIAGMLAVSGSGGLGVAWAQAQPPATGAAADEAAKAEAAKAEAAKAEAAKVEADRVAAAKKAAEAPGPDPQIYKLMFDILFSVFVIALVLESALAVIFNWSIFLRYFDGRGVKTLLSVIVAWIVVGALQIDVVGRLFEATSNAPKGSHPLGFVGYFISALVVGGGSAVVHNIMRGLGLRSVLTRDDVTPRPAKEHAWLAISLKRTKGVNGAISVLLTKDQNPAQLIGVISGKRSPPPFLRGFLTDPARFPQVAGYAVDGEHTYTVTLQGTPPAPGAAAPTASWGPYTVAKGAIVDIDLTV